MINEQALLKKVKKEVIGSKVGNELMLMNMETGDYIHFNEMGTVIWNLLDANQTIDLIVAELLETFDISEEICRAEVNEFIYYLVDNHLVKVE